jgi:hypothetical protein
MKVELLPLAGNALLTVRVATCPSMVQALKYCQCRWPNWSKYHRQEPAAPAGGRGHRDRAERDDAIVGNREDAAARRRIIGQPRLRDRFDRPSGPLR